MIWTRKKIKFSKEEMLSALQEPIYKTSKIDNLKQRAEFRKQRTDLRHQATKSEVQKYNELFKELEEETYKTMDCAWIKGI